MLHAQCVVGHHRGACCLSPRPPPALRASTRRSHGDMAAADRWGRPTPFVGTSWPRRRIGAAGGSTSGDGAHACPRACGGPYCTSIQPSCDTALLPAVGDLAMSYCTAILYCADISLADRRTVLYCHTAIWRLAVWACLAIAALADLAASTRFLTTPEGAVATPAPSRPATAEPVPPEPVAGEVRVVGHLAATGQAVKLVSHPGPNGTTRSLLKVHGAKLRGGLKTKDFFVVLFAT